MTRFLEILELLEKLPKEANYFGTVDKLKYTARIGIKEYSEAIKKASHQGN